MVRLIVEALTCAKFLYCFCSYNGSLQYSFISQFVYYASWMGYMFGSVSEEIIVVGGSSWARSVYVFFTFEQFNFVKISRRYNLHYNDKPNEKRVLRTLFLSTYAGHITCINLIHSSLDMNIRLYINNKGLNNLISISRHGLKQEFKIIC
ncbi:hypothetical protein Ahy_B04g073346 isoform D [Arachis hypogaea]|uniref:Uncharacterized protein n=1 Tax=Arachis hypogaea TaxID=3818 RepID=A0A444ZQB6_ARAHY|nr:hypothetical protein Ahy_B04g073346 isoform D [Arachis hypogaea]